MKAPGQWSRRTDGLYIPTGTEEVPAPPGNVAQPASQAPSDRRMPEWLMALASIVSAVLAFSSIAVAVAAFKTQTSALEEERQARATADASKVTWWSDAERGMFNVRNATGAQIFLAAFKFEGEGTRPTFVVLPSTPPCTMLSVPSYGPDAKRIGIPDDVPTSMSFLDSAGSWTRSITGSLKSTEEGDLPAGPQDKMVPLIEGDKSMRYTAIEGCT